ncbi:hypothetical protein NMG60_11033015 [Bertholletia excelsa]
MEEAKPKGVVKHILLAKFKDSVPPEQIDQLIKGYASLLGETGLLWWKMTKHILPPKRTWFSIKLYFPLTTLGRDVSIENLHQGFTHVFESTFETVEGIADYVSHPAHVEFANIFLPALEKFLVVDYKPEPVQL